MRTLISLSFLQIIVPPPYPSAPRKHAPAAFLRVSCAVPGKFFGIVSDKSVGLRNARFVIGGGGLQIFDVFAVFRDRVLGEIDLVAQ